jgi:hypothetical protein
MDYLKSDSGHCCPQLFNLRQYKKRDEETIKDLREKNENLKQEVVMNGVWTDKQSLRMDEKDAKIFKLNDLLKKKLSNSIFEKLED